jgi:hypothetical protein
MTNPRIDTKVKGGLKNEVDFYYSTGIMKMPKVFIFVEAGFLNDPFRILQDIPVSFHGEQIELEIDGRKQKRKFFFTSGNY